MNRTVFTAAFAFLLAGSLAIAQAPQAPAPDAQPPAAQPTAPARTPNPHRQAVRIARQLSLTPDQAAKLEPILADRDQKIAALRADPSIAPNAARKQLRVIRQSTQQQLSTVLSPEQLQQLRSLQRSRKSQPQPAATPTA
jgi:Spy/CpxP family protein refolding chaperone